ncbi:MAG: amidohydrolase [Bacteroidota bacterium]
MQDLRLTLVQMDIHWQQPAKNREKVAGQIKSLTGQTDLIILPEMFTTGFSMDAATQAENMDGETVTWMRNWARQLGAAITGSLIIEEAGHYYNRLVWMAPDGEFQAYDKRHLFAMAGEDAAYTRGQDRLIVNYRGWRICPLICYDLRFPVWARNDDAYDLLIYIANWPDRRAYDWQTLLRARAIENQCYVAAVNRVGEDVNGLHYQGDSCVIDPGWRKVLYQQSQQEAVQTIKLSAEQLQRVREKLPFLADRDEFVIVE